MSIIEHAKSEMKLANVAPDDAAVVVEILEKFFDQFDSGDSVSVAAPMLQRLIAGKPLSPLTGADNEWMEVSEDFYQNIRCGSVFKVRTNVGAFPAGTCYDVALSGNPAITFPYYPEKAEVPSPVVEAQTSDAE
jgi:hypothetical protein